MFCDGKAIATAVKAARRPGRLGDGEGLFLVVSVTGGKSWVCRVQKNGRRRDIGLGSAGKVSLAIARKRAAEPRGTPPEKRRALMDRWAEYCSLPTA
ncbi:integrase arm-type DNA-binding domain-containing protein [Sphingomonas sp. JC676]|nr:integrase arm-type DNA-binding domain-containing protein [Sphingomonas sp. JC676]